MKQSNKKAKEVAKDNNKLLPRRYFAYIAIAATLAIIKAFLFVPVTSNQDFTGQKCEEFKNIISFTEYLKNNNASVCSSYKVESLPYFLGNILIFVIAITFFIAVDKIIFIILEHKAAKRKKQA